MSTNDASSEKRIFLSYSHSDRDVAERIALALHHAGELVWWDEWEILAGDSLVEKIFRQGLASASAFLIVLSETSAKSRWVLEELDVATVRKIEGLTRVIPVLIDDVEIPVGLRTLRRIDIRKDFDQGIIEIANAVHGISSKPPAPARPSISTRLSANVAGLSKAASTVAQCILSMSDIDAGQEVAVSGPELSKTLELDPTTINDAVDELEESGFVRVLKFLGTAPYRFGQLQPTYVLYRELSENLDYDPEDDIRTIAAAIASAGRIRAKEIADVTKLSPGRINRAAEYLEDFGVADIHKTLGTFPFRFAWVSANRRTRQLVSEQ